MMPLLLSYCGRLRYLHALEVVPYGKSSVERARVKAARAAQRDDAADRANLRRAHRTAESVDNGGKDINTSGRPTGTSRAYALRRLREQRPDIHARVLAGEISPHAGMVEAGFRSARGRDSARRKFPATRRRQN